MQLIVVLLLLAGAAAVRVPREVQAPLLGTQRSSQPRQLLAKANQNCSAAQIPGCVPSQRVVRFRQGCVCLKCATTRGYVPAARSPLDKKAALQCVCRPGFYELGGSCAACEEGTFCPGGNATAKTAQDDRGTRKPCAVGFTTAARQSISAQACVAVKQTVLSSPDPVITNTSSSQDANATSTNRADLCTGDSYAAPPSNTLQICIKCPKGFVAPPDFTGPHTDKVTVCHVPPGMYYTGISTRECPQGTYRGSYARTDDPASLACTPCPEGSTTQTYGSLDITQCKLCIDGWGKVPGDAGGLTDVCGPCNYGEWSNSGYLDTINRKSITDDDDSMVAAAANAVTGGACRLCPGTTFQHAVGPAFVSYGLTFATKNKNPESCVPRFSQLPVAAGAKLCIQKDTAFSAIETEVSLQDCVQACPVDSCCIAEFEVPDGGSTASGTCKRAVLPPLGRGNMTKPALYYKLPPSSLMSGASDDSDDSGDGAAGARRRLQSSGSGLFARCDMTQWGSLPGDGYIGVSPNPAMIEAPMTFVEWNAAGCTDESSCKDACLFDAPCWGFIYVPEKGWALRGGEDNLASRSFFAIPDPTKTTPPLDMEALSW